MPELCYSSSSPYIIHVLSKLNTNLNKSLLSNRTTNISDNVNISHILNNNNEIVFKLSKSLILTEISNENNIKTSNDINYILKYLVRMFNSSFLKYHNITEGDNSVINDWIDILHNSRHAQINLSEIITKIEQNLLDSNKFIINEQLSILDFIICAYLEKSRQFPKLKHSEPLVNYLKTCIAHELFSNIEFGNIKYIINKYNSEHAQNNNYNNIQAHNNDNINNSNNNTHAQNNFNSNNSMHVQNNFNNNITHAHNNLNNITSTHNNFNNNITHAQNKFSSNNLDYAQINDLNKNTHAHNNFNNFNNTHAHNINLNINDNINNLVNNTHAQNKNKNFNNNLINNYSSNECILEQGGKFLELPNAHVNNVKTRFPPEASGYLHIGHAKAALLNQIYRDKYRGKLIMRFDDTNPRKEKTEYENIILEDIKLLNLTPDEFTRTSDHFETLLSYAHALISKGLAYCDDTPVDILRSMRNNKIESKYRNTSIDDNKRIFNAMIRGDYTNSNENWILRAKIDYKSDNGCLRDPVIYRTCAESHPVHNDKYKVYPTYDFACPIVDSIEGVTHALRTLEYHDRDAQYRFFCEKLGLRMPEIIEFSKISLQHTVLSKRKLTKIVDSGLVSGWDDPRMPTIRGFIRRGLTPTALKQFIIAQGFSKSEVHMKSDKLWSFNRQIIDTHALRLVSLFGELSEFEIINFDENYNKNNNLNENNIDLVKNNDINNNFIKQKSINLVPKNPNLGSRIIKYTNNIYIERIELKSLKIDEMITLINLGNARVKEINENSCKLELMLENKEYSKTKKISCLNKINIKNNIPNNSNIFNNTQNINNNLLNVNNSYINDDNVKLTIYTYKNLITKGILSQDDNFEDYINKDSLKITHAIGEPYFKQLTPGTVVQIIKKGYYRVDKAYTEDDGIILIEIPTGDTSDGDKIVNNKTNKFSSKNSSKKNVSNGNASDKIDISNDVSKLNIDCKKEVKNEHKKDEYKSKVETKVDKCKKNDKVKKVEKVDKCKKQQTTGSSNTDSKKTKLGLLAHKEKDFSQWYTELITKSEMLDYYSVSGCYVIRPWAFHIWERIQTFVDVEIKSYGVQNCYFPMFVSESALIKEKDHISDFAPEVAWVTRAGSTDLAEPIAIRPTSETVMYPIFSKWIQSYRDLPLKLNQWCNVVRWEFKHPTPFLRTREFLWQEGHTVYSNKEEAVKEVYQIIDLYARVYTDLLAIPVVRGVKSEAEKFAGAEFTTTVEGYIPAVGRGLQGGTSHHLSQNFSKMFDIGFDDPATNEKQFAFQNSWGLSTRTIGALVMIHGDNKGLVLPPRVSPIQVVIIPCGISSQTTEKDKSEIISYCNNLFSLLKSADIRVKLDDRDHVTPGWKYNDWELKGVPIRIEVGPKDILTRTVMMVRRDTGEKSPISIDIIAKHINEALELIQKSMYERALNDMNNNMVICEDWNNFMDFLNAKKIIYSPFCGKKSCEEIVRKISAVVTQEIFQSGEVQSVVAMGAKTLCIPSEQPKSLVENTKCIRPECQENAQFYALFGRSF